MSFRSIFAVFLLGIVCLGAGCSTKKTTDSAPTISKNPPPSSEVIAKMSPSDREIALQSYLAQNPPKALTQDELDEEALRMRQVVEGGQVKRIARIFAGPRNSYGEMRIVEKNGKLYLALSETFRIDPGPSLTIEICDQLEPQSESDLQKALHSEV